MRHTYFEIQNFKGISNIRLEFDAHPRSNIYTLVGLNESGKTTILEALNFLKPETLVPLNLPGYSVKDLFDLIPINKRGNFNDAIQIKAGYELDEDDKETIKEFLLKKLDFRTTRDLTEFHITQSYLFRAGVIQLSQSTTTGSFEKLVKGVRIQGIKELDKKKWPIAFEFIKTLLPSVLYFPNFFFEFPERIYLEDVSFETEKHEFYRTVLQDVLDSIGDRTNLNDHVLVRAKDGSANAKTMLKSVLQSMGAHIGSTVYKEWDEIFKSTRGHKKVNVEYEHDDEGKFYLQLGLEDRDQRYKISERSLGFRWFFAFLLLTQYRGFRKGAPKNVLFLFDEPASNLHPSAQSQLLKSFGAFPENCAVVYTTHSHHMINADWLERTYVVRNQALRYNPDDENVNKNETVITLDRYRTFVAKHPNQTTYFQPILDVLDYAPSKLENIPDVVMVEGKNDFYTLKYFQEKIFKGTYNLNLMPGNGCGGFDPLIRLYLAWGREFVVLLDSDKPGEDNKTRYENLFGLWSESVSAPSGI